MLCCAAVDDRAKIVLKGVPKSQHVAALQEKYAHILDKPKEFTVSFDRKSLRDLEAGRRLTEVSKVFQKAFQTNESFQDRKEADSDKEFKAKI